MEKLITHIDVENQVLLASGQGVIIPAGALTQSITIGVRVTVAPTLPGPQITEGLARMSEALHFSPSGTVFKKTVTLQIGFNGSAARGNRAAIYKFNRQTLMWDEQPESVTYLTEYLVRVKTMSFSTFYAVFQRPVPVPPPLKVAMISRSTMMDKIEELHKQLEETQKQLKDKQKHCTVPK